MPKNELDLATALGRGDPEAVADLLAAGANVRYKREHRCGQRLGNPRQGDRRPSM